MTPPPPSDRLVYKTVGGIQLWIDVFTPPCPASPPPLPGILLFHGGGWDVSFTDQFHPQCRYFASRGIAAFAAEYRVTEKHGSTPFDSLADAKSAVRWLRAHAGELGVDPAKLAVGGGSSGGHVAAAAATVAAFDDEADDRSIDARPNALALFNPVVDTGPGGYGHERLGERWRELSPRHNVTAGAPPTIIFQGTDDPYVSVASATAFKRRMDEVGARCDLWLYDGQPHGFFHYLDGNNPYYNATICQTDRFLASLGYLAGEPGLPEPAVAHSRLRRNTSPNSRTEGPLNSSRCSPETS